MATLFHALSGYLQAFITAAASINAKECITNPTVFRAVMLLFPDVAQRVQDRHGRLYTVENFDEVLEPAISGLRPTLLNKPGNASRALHSELQNSELTL